MKALAIIAALSLAGCATPPVMRDDVGRLLATPGMGAAMKASPEWTSEALRTVAELDRELNRISPK